MYQSERLSFTGYLIPVIQRACAAYGVGDLVAFVPIETGCEDYNLKIETTSGKYVLKILANFRTPAEELHYINVLEAVRDAGVAHPRVLNTNNGGIAFLDSGMRMILMEYVDGRDFFALSRVPNDTELDFICGQIAKINKIKIPEFQDMAFGYWNVENMHKTFNEARKFLNPSDTKLVTRAMGEFDTIPVDKLPRAFCHRDMIKTNFIKTDKNLFVIDFSAGNVYPKIYDLAVVIYALMFDGIHSIPEITKKVVGFYNKYEKLTDIEIEFLPKFSLGCATMELIGSVRWKYLSNQKIREIDDLINLGRQNLNLYFNNPKIYQ